MGVSTYEEVNADKVSAFSPHLKDVNAIYIGENLDICTA